MSPEMTRYSTESNYQASAGYTEVSDTTVFVYGGQYLTSSTVIDGYLNETDALDRA